ncbi:baseplate J/gp47 family protein [Yersinia pekkanenii]|uniref:Uncharacterized homolog of phage Mu protein gp47 n=1 Tax=Yersinia pekkanenii TaxID=1288385 RepID=A0A0T9PR46_9GAMM|nr:baseplate J/gp47 family protein [Yersinia pekkanenii]CNH77682.1 Uncharacterized homolog of phage Mu protein gp47 [Yersinia pekkanenii]CRY69359.1 Uncharacterized homolog of phage Mu protein gp47 [Yersinia pekkanenii]
MAEITKHGVIGTTLSEYLDAMRQRYLDIDDGWNINPESPDGLAIAAWCETLANIDEAVVNSYHSADPNSAIGQQLDRIAAFAGIKRQDATHSTATVTFSGADLTPIPKGTLVRNRVTNTLWATDVDTTIGGTGTVKVNVTCMDMGGLAANSNNLTIIASPVGGVTAVTNDAPASIGLSEESNDAFRIRRNESVALPGSNQIDNIYASLANIDSVKQARIYENEDSLTDENGVFGHSMAIFVDGGEVESISLAIATKKNPGCGLNRYNSFPNKIAIDTVTPGGNPISITFYRPEFITIYVKVEISSNNRFNDDEIKQAIVDYANYGFNETSGFAKTGFKIGENVGAGRIFTPLNYIVSNDGFVNSILVGKIPNDVTHTVVDVRFNQLGVFSTENIEVAYV